MKQLLKKVSPLNNRTDMPVSLFVIKKILAFWVCYIAGLFLAEGLVILLHFALGKNMLVGDVFDAETITLITYYGYIVIAGVALLYWKAVEKKPLAAMAVSTILFILPHCLSLFAGKIIYGIIGVVNLILISAVFSLLTIRFKSIWAACGLHSFWNTILYSVLGLNLSGNGENVAAIFNMQSVGDNIWNGSIYGIEASIATGIVLIFAVALIYAITRIKGK